MHSKHLSGFCLLALFALFSGCNSIESVKSTRGTGKTVAYAVDFKTAWAALPPAIKAVGLEVAEVNEGGRTITAESGMNLLSYGSRVAIFVEETGPKATRVEVVSKRVIATNITAKDWTEPLFTELGKRLPVAP